MGFFVYTMSQVQARARTKAGIWRMYIIETIVEMVYKVYESGLLDFLRLITQFFLAKMIQILTFAQAAFFEYT